ncbi:unnamed protein product, partial [Protopolystoma xenopodis]
VGVAYFKNEDQLLTALKKSNQKINGKAIKVCRYPPDDLYHYKQNKPEKREKPNWPEMSKEDALDLIKETGRLYIRNLSYSCTEKDIESLFSPFGSLSELNLAYDYRLRKHKGFGFVTFLFSHDAITAFEKLDKTEFLGRLLHILPSKECPSVHLSKSDKNDLDVGQSQKNPKGPQTTSVDLSSETASSFQNERLQGLKSSSSRSHNWNILFIQPDAVATYLAAKFGVAKEELLMEKIDRKSRSSDNITSASIRFAQGEAQLVMELRTYLKSNGVNLNILESCQPTSFGSLRSLVAPITLSSRIFLIKNLPISIIPSEVRDLISSYLPSDCEAPIRVLVPPLGLTAIVQFSAPQVARRVYMAMAYEKQQH